MMPRLQEPVAGSGSPTRIINHTGLDAKDDTTEPRPDCRNRFGTARAASVRYNQRNGPNRCDHFFAFTLGANTGVTVGAADLEHNGHADLLTGYTVQPVYRVVRATAQGVAPPAVFQNVPPDLQGGLSVGA